MSSTNDRIVSINAVAVINEALRELVPDVGLKVRRSFAFDSHAMNPLEFVQSMGMLSPQGTGLFTTRAVGFLLIPMTAVFAPMSPGECGALSVLERRLAFLETIVRYTHFFYREVVARELETAPASGVDRGAPALVSRIGQLCLQLLDDDAMCNVLLGSWEESQHGSAGSTRTLHHMSDSQVIWATGLDRYVLSETGLAWERHGRPWFDRSHIDGCAYNFNHVPQSHMYSMLASDQRQRPAMTLVSGSGRRGAETSSALPSGLASD
ncbi:hypothetical protein H8Z72_22890 (plasmid) [Xanthomonas citri pv. citri]|uniref:hypothetical protein n=1 Tax=Xanthomonas citri TaxID=346 RepID=UPI001933AB4D|nr:hypothetical protein [Xanthomonas citri]QRD62622.1 hypothetical protein H8Z74_23295 [Xanthomonas citri pv. citri]QRD67157.1 hypothetical protein H8Z73_22275 [Xanthomonas citri pv. citri]QRD71798.1 hypothetical protein H8Z72_22890 [Xanthomonas citri pv. citri]